MSKSFMKAVMIFAVMTIAATGLVAQKYAIVFKNTGNPYGEKQMAGFKAGIEEQKFEAILRAPDAPTAEAQIQIALKFALLF